jgi:hypothetical protein
LIAAQKAIQKGEEATDPKVRELMAALSNDKDVKPAIAYALRKFLVPYQRTVLDALHLGNATPDEIHEATEMPYEAIAAYGEYIFDRTVFEDRLDRKTWVESMISYLQPNEAQILMVVMTIGVNYLVWYLTGRGKFTPAEVLRFTMNDAMFRSFAHRMAPLDSAVSKEAHNWARTAERVAKSLHQVDPQDNEEARKQLYIALSHRDETGNAQTTGIPAEKILH